jgi:hypothetical protein
MHRKQDWQAFWCEPSRHPGVVGAGCEACGKTITPKTVLRRDKASIHPSEALADRLPPGKKHGGISTCLPTSSPAFNLIAILWRRITYAWVPFSASACLNAMIEALDNMLSTGGSKYQITFA